MLNHSTGLCLNVSILCEHRVENWFSVTLLSLTQMFVVAGLSKLPQFCLCCSSPCMGNYLYLLFFTCLRTSSWKLSIDCNLHKKLGQNIAKVLIYHNSHLSRLSHSDSTNAWSQNGDLPPMRRKPSTKIPIEAPAIVVVKGVVFSVVSATWRSQTNELSHAINVSFETN